MGVGKGQQRFDWHVFVGADRVAGMRYIALVILVALAGCSAIRSTKDRLFGENQTLSEPVVTDVSAEAPEGVAQTPIAADPGWNGARQTIAGLGDPTRPGRWLETPLVKTEINGRVVTRDTGAQVYVLLIPAPGPQGAGSRLSLEAMQSMLLPLDQLVELNVYSN